MSRRVTCVGECMVELRRKSADLASLTFSGDALNAAVYLRRQAPADVAVAFATAVGDDPLSDEMIAEWRAEGIEVDRVGRVPGGLPGIYLVDVDRDGERHFSYWRDSSAARRMVHAPGAATLVDDAAWVYVTGITLAILPPDDRRRLLERIRGSREDGAVVAVDTNYRPALWESADEARDTLETLLCGADVALTSLDDLAHLWELRDAPAALAWLDGLGVREPVVRRGAEGVDLEGAHVPAEQVVPVDTTAAGDAFNGAYVAARLGGAGPVDAARRASALAAEVVQHLGAIVPREVTAR